jgi:plastocyanin
MRSRLFLVFLFLLLTQIAEAAGPHLITMKSLSYDPKQIEISAGDSVEWVNKSYTAHSASANDKSFETGLVQPGQHSKEIVFKKPGTYSYHCQIHGMTMSGTLIVIAH